MKHQRRYLFLALLAMAAAVLVLRPWQAPGPSSGPSTPPGTPGPNNSRLDDPKPSYAFIDLQPTVNVWASRQKGEASVVVYDLANGRHAASLNPSRQYFTASIYKLYVAYAGYQKAADGTYGMNEPYLSGYTHGKCLDAMIRDSYSPCGEKMWNQLGKENLTAKMSSYGLTDTSLTGLQTSAKDAAALLQRLYEKKDLNGPHTALFLDSMKDQPAQYRRGLPSGFSKSIVYNKVGWNGLVDWHDAAIVTLPDKRSYVITVFTERIGSAQVKALGQAIESRLLR